jgi:very-short-patch-repair endonuclease
MTSLGLTVVRIPNAVLLADPKATLEQIAANLPSPPGRGVTLPPENVSLVE